MNKWFGISGWVVAVLLIAGSVSGQHEEHHQANAQPAPQEQAAPPSPEMCKMMQDKMGDMHMKMMQKHNDLQHMLNEMNSSTGPAKVDAMARVVTAMVDQQGEMHKMEMGMMGEMMSHMGQHMMQGMSPEAKKDMMMCPMMSSMNKGMGGMKDMGGMKGMDSMKKPAAPGAPEQAPNPDAPAEHEHHQ